MPSVLKGKFSALLFSFCPGFPASWCAKICGLLPVTYSMSVFKWSLVSSVQYCGLMQIVTQFRRYHSRKVEMWYALVTYPLTWPHFLWYSCQKCLQHLPRICVSDNCHLTLLFWTRSDDVLCLNQALHRIISELRAVLISKRVTRLYPVGSHKGQCLKTSFTLLKSLKRNFTNEITAVCLA